MSRHRCVSSKSSAKKGKYATKNLNLEWKSWLNMEAHGNSEGNRRSYSEKRQSD